MSKPGFMLHATTTPARNNSAENMRCQLSHSRDIFRWLSSSRNDAICESWVRLCVSWRVNPIFSGVLNPDWWLPAPTCLSLHVCLPSWLWWQLTPWPIATIGRATSQLQIWFHYIYPRVSFQVSAPGSILDNPRPVLVRRPWWHLLKHRNDLTCPLSPCVGPTETTSPLPLDSIRPSVSVNNIRWNLWWYYFDRKTRVEISWAITI